MTASPQTDIRSIVSRLDRDCRHLISEAADLAYSRSHNVLSIEHVLAALCAPGNAALLATLRLTNFDVGVARTQLGNVLNTYETGYGLPPAISERLITLLRDALVEVSLSTTPLDLVSIAGLMRAVVRDEPTFTHLQRIAPLMEALRETGEANAAIAEQEATMRLTALRPALARYTVDLTAKAAAKEIDPVIGRDQEIAEVIQILLRRRQNNPILVGEAGVGKTAIVEGLAQRIVAGLVPQELKSVQLCSLDMGLLKAGAAMRGEIESRLKHLIAEVASSEHPVILFVDEAHTLVAASSQSETSDIANLIKPELARGTLRTIAATTWAEYKRHFEKDAALTRRFQTVKVDEPSTSVAEDILQGLTPALERHHGVRILQSAIGAAVRLSTRYIQSRQLPDKAISVLDTACARSVAALTAPASAIVRLEEHVGLLTTRVAALQQEHEWGLGTADAVQSVQAELETASQQLANARADFPSSSPEEAQPVLVTDADVANVIAQWTGVPSQQMLTQQYNLVAQLAQTLTQRIVGQPRAIKMISDRVRSFTVKLEDPGRPIGVFLLAGPSGVGKTETAHALAETFFGPSGITVINMSEYQEAHTVSKLKGAPAGYVGFGQGGVLTEAIRRRPYGLLLLDEIEKAHPDVLNLFLQVFDKGFVDDAEGLRIDFKNTLIILTSNAASELLEMSQDMPGSDDSPTSESLATETQLHERLQEHFSPAFLGRVQVVPYYGLGRDDLQSIVRMKLEVVARRFTSSYSKHLHFDDSILDEITQRCAAQSIGARWVDQYLSSNISARISAHVLEQLVLGHSIDDLDVSFAAGRVIVAASGRANVKGEVT